MKTAIEVLLDAFENSMCKDANQKSRSQYRSVINALGKDEVFKTDAEKNFLTLVIKLIANNREDECIKLIGLLRYSVCVYNWGSLRSYETYCNKFTDFLEKLLSSEAASKKSIKKKIASACTTPTLSDTEESWLKTAFAKRTVFLHEQLMTKFMGRLRRQDRISGNKVWLPLSYIAKLYKKAGKTKEFTDWLRKLAEGIFVHYEDDNKEIKSVQFKAQQVFLVFEKIEKKKNSDGKKPKKADEVKYDVGIVKTQDTDAIEKSTEAYNVKVALSASNKCYTAYTPTGDGNTKVSMIVKDISDIAIDHVKPIDLTLKELGDKGRIPNLKMVSDSFRDMMGRPEKADKDIEDESLDQLYNNVDINKLTDELYLIRTDGVLRLMVSEYNGKKSNSTAYDKIIKIKGKEEYLGLLGEALLDDETIYLYQRLNERDAKTRASREEPKGTKVKISKKIINLI